MGTVDDRIAGQLESKWNDQFVGWEDSAKFPLSRPIEFALKRERNQAIETLHVTAESLYDHGTDGFYRYTDNRDWSTLRKKDSLYECC
ncbi:hypothetical protein [Haloquadratum walsbyi]|uniref:Uncharacterized protein n=1 Tax=Haloquadratum walsbyi J07HQW2 TaxID=1238425 RepID=U1NFE8_9EURY|nr:hypothetical protein [Haloquadratum walsbyi]ERG95528.1 MAG: hypothetical protein J07HQW2_01986 [Haloquadratum walsbyi J07HQW2]